MKTIKVLLASILALSFLTFTNCGEDDEPGALTIVSIIATGTDVETGESATVDLNQATSAVGVPVDLSVEITFNKEVDAESVSSSSVTIEGVETSVSVDGAVVTLTASGELERGTDYSLSIGAISANDGGEFTAISRTFTTGGRAEVVPPKTADQVVYWNFDGDANDQVGSNDPSAVIDIEFQEDRFGQASSAAYFDGETSIIEYPNGSSLTDGSHFTISFWIKTNTVDHVNADGNLTGMFVFGLGAFFGIQYEIFDSYEGSKFAISYENDAGDLFGEDMFFPSEATDNTTGGWQGWTFAKSIPAEQMQGILKDNWYHVIYTFDGSERVGSLYFDGELMKSFDFDLWPEGGVKQTGAALKYRGAEPDVLDEFALGFIHSRGGTMWDSEPWGGYEFTTAKHFKGWLDDFRIFHAAFSADDAAALYDAEAP